ncbi:MAG: hypothetical protein PHC66_03070 [Candidatus Nanoarchaeia archaeon]|nr:hypothetical protein [Candidatus Nanoarchaeia archaeon]MDD5239305.1 hypothetical protein [Candidatus Nanoarchaeia archaeon]
MKTVLRWLNKRGISTDAFVIVLLVIGLAVAVGILIYFVVNSKSAATDILNLSTPLQEALTK